MKICQASLPERQRGFVDVTGQAIRTYLYYLPMKKVTRFISAFWLMGGLLIILAAAMAMATFIENDYGASAAKALVYNTWWFELIFLGLGINLAGNILLFKMGQKRDYAVFLFHISFFLIIAGAAVTRYIGYEGVMHLREGGASDKIISTDAYVLVKLFSENDTLTLQKKVFFSAATPNVFSGKIKEGDNVIKINSIGFIPNAIQRPVEMPGGNPFIGLVFSNRLTRDEIFVKEGGNIERDGIKIGFESSDNPDLDVNIYRDTETGKFGFFSKIAVSKIIMESGLTDVLDINEKHNFQPGVIFDFGHFRMVFSRFYNSAVLQPFSMHDPTTSELPNAVVLNVNHNNNPNQLIVYGKTGIEGVPTELKLGSLKLTVQYGSLPLNLPFSLYLNKFNLERYAGSNSPSSYNSNVTLIDNEMGVKEQRDIFMNNILNYRGFRFYQSSYDQDEKGTILSVNNDAVGTFITYVGYFIMSLGMILSLLVRKTRFRHLMNEAEKVYKKRKELTLLLFLLIPLNLPAQIITTPKAPSEEIASRFGKIWVQDNGGRIKPLNTLHQEIALKLVKHNSFKGLTADQLVLGIMAYPSDWQTTPLITIKDPKLKNLLGINGKKAAFVDFFSGERQYKLYRLVDAAYRKNPAKRDKFEQELVKVDEQVNVFYLTQTASLHKIFPSKNFGNKPWYTPAIEPATLNESDSIYITSVIDKLINMVRENNVEGANVEIDGIIKYQIINALELLPSETKLNFELLYNRLNIFMWLATFFFILGSVLMLFQFLALLKPSFYFKWLMKTGYALLFAGFIYHTSGLALRWYISGHAPWSNGYESMIFIGWAILMAGFLMSRKSNMVLPITALFSGVVLMVAHLSWMNPQITNLVPVLKSYWLTLHVSVIIGGYGFLALGALLGFLNLLLTILKNKANRIRFQLTIDELTAINEMSLTAGLYLMTIGSFLGGIWANESWGRYWGWDPKETWSLITIVLYAFVLHMRFIPGLKGFIALNTASVITFGSVIMTYLGVNYYLSGLHSYAGGEPVPIPTFVYYSVVIIAVVIFVARLNQARLEKLFPNDVMQE